jgi:hypothetical protein
MSSTMSRYSWKKYNRIRPSVTTLRRRSFVSQWDPTEWEGGEVTVEHYFRSENMRHQEQRKWFSIRLMIETVFY